MSSRWRAVFGVSAGLVLAATLLAAFLIRAARAGQDALVLTGPTPAERRHAEDVAHDLWQALLARESRPSAPSSADGIPRFHK